MSMDRSLKQHGGLIRTRSVLTRTERIAQLTEEGRFDPEKDSPFGLLKVKVRHSRAGTKTKKAAEETAAVEGAEGAAPVEGAAEAKPGAKGEAKPVKGEARVAAKGDAKTAKPEPKAEKGEKKK